MLIRNTRPEELHKVMDIYEQGRSYMRQHGNMEQWKDNYPPEELIKQDISSNVSYVIEDDNGDIIGVFAFLEGPDVTYNRIYEGAWPNDKPYFVIHRIAVSRHRKGVASFVYSECLKKCNVLRIDTHKDNIPMQNSLKKNGFNYCGIIQLLSGDERLAYQKERNRSDENT